MCQVPVWRLVRRTICVHKTVVVRRAYVYEFNCTKRGGGEAWRLQRLVEKSECQSEVVWVDLVYTYKDKALHLFSETKLTVASH